ncbi:hypothetical protein GQ457_17G011200 [Hibiscus cannabinus]
MAVFLYLGFLMFGIIFLRFIDNNGLPRNWPFVGMIPTLILNLHRPHHKVADTLKRSNGTFFFKGIWFTNTSYLGTSDPENVRYILSSDNSVYLKGSEWLKQFDIFGEALFNSDGEARKHHRKVFYALDDVLTHYISIQRHKSKELMASPNEDDDFNFVKCYLTGHEITGPTPKESLIRDNIANFFLASVYTYSSTFTWFFYLISKKDMVEIKIRQEIKRHLSMKQVESLQIPSNFDDLSKLTYLHAAFNETLRLFPPIPFEFRTCTKPDFLPSGHRVDRNTRVLIGIHAMGRMESLWGEDCYEFKPERWISEEGKLIRESPSKFCAFLAGPRICAGKELSFLLMKATATAIIHNYNVHVLEGQNISPKNSVLYQMKKGFMVRVKNI